MNGSLKNDVVWTPQEGGQKAFLSCPLFEVLAEGNRGGGKTDVLIMDFCQHVGQGFGPAWRGILFRQNYPQLGDVISKTRKWISKIWPAAKYNSTEHFWLWPGGETLLLRSFARDDDYWNFHGHEYTWVGWEELANWPTLSGYKRMMSVCRSSSPDIPRKYRATTNPYGPGHNQIKARFRLPSFRNRIISDATDDEGNVEPPRVAVNVALEQNKVLLENDPNYLQRLRASARNPAELAAWLHGDWNIVSGGMFDDVWDPRVHVLDPFPIPASWKIDRSFDWGSSAPFSVGWWATSDGSDFQPLPSDDDPSPSPRSTHRGDLFRIGEWYGWNGQPNEGTKMLATEVARGIVEYELENKLRTRVRVGPADTAIFNIDNGRSIADDMAQQIRLSDGSDHSGIFWARADKSPGSRKIGWEQVRDRLKSSIPNLGSRHRPGLFVFSTCEQFIRTVPVLPRDMKDLDDVDTRAEDHVADEVRYRVRYASQQVGQTTNVGGW